MNPYLANLIYRFNKTNDCFTKKDIRESAITTISQIAKVDEKIAKMVFTFLSKGKVELSCEKLYSSENDIPEQFKKAMQYCGIPFKEVNDVRYGGICLVYITPILC